MKLVRIGPAGEETPAVLADDGTLLDLTGLADDIDGAMLAAGAGCDPGGGGRGRPAAAVPARTGAR
jgi:hypothetical protein